MPASAKPERSCCRATWPSSGAWASLAPPVRLSSLVVRAFAPSAERGRPLVVGVFSFAYLISFPLAIGPADESHLLYGAKRILQGEVIYKDFFESITPLSFYLFAALYRIAGTTLLTARVGMAVIAAFGCALLFHLVRGMSSALEGTLAVPIFAGFCVPTWPYASAHRVVSPRVVGAGPLAPAGSALEDVGPRDRLGRRGWGDRDAGRPGSRGLGLFAGCAGDVRRRCSRLADDATRFSVLVAGYFPPEFVHEMLGVLDMRRPGTVVLNLAFAPKRCARPSRRGTTP